MKRGVPDISYRRSRNISFDSGLLGDYRQVPKIVKKAYPDKKASELGQSIASARIHVARGNSAMFFTHLYQGLFGGRLDREFSYPVRVVNGNNRRFHPDIVHKSNSGETSYVELKSFCNSWHGNTLVRVAQFENYIKKILDDFDKSQLDPSLDVSNIGFYYGYFRFKSAIRRKKTKKKDIDGRPILRKVRKNGGLTQKNPEDTIDYLSENVRDLLLIPSNLAMFLGSISQRVGDYKGQGGQWRISSGDLTALHSGGINKLMRGYDLEDEDLDLSEILLLDSLESKVLDVPKVNFAGRRINPDFRVTVYGFESRDSALAWSNYLRGHHEALLEERLGIMDLYAESKRGDQISEEAKVYSAPDEDEIEW